MEEEGENRTDRTFLLNGKIGCFLSPRRDRVNGSDGEAQQKNEEPQKRRSEIVQNGPRKKKMCNEMEECWDRWTV